MRRLTPSVVVNVGGYASFPATAAATLCRIPVVVVSYDRRPGWSRSWRHGAPRRAPWPSRARRCRGRTSPVRRFAARCSAIDRAADRAFGAGAARPADDRFVVAVFGGSLGRQAAQRGPSRSRRAARRAATIWPCTTSSASASRRDAAARVAIGSHGHHVPRARLRGSHAAGLCRGRPDDDAGRRGTIAELATVGMPAMIVPWPGAAENHQVDNARELSDHRGAVLIEERDLTRRSADRARSTS